MKPTPIVLAGLLAMTLVALAPAATANPGPDVTVVVHTPIVCSIQRTVTVGDITVTVNNCSVETVHLHADVFTGRCPSLSLPPLFNGISLRINSDCSVVATVTV